MSSESFSISEIWSYYSWKFYSGSLLPSKLHLSTQCFINWHLTDYIFTVIATLLKASLRLVILPNPPSPGTLQALIHMLPSRLEILPSFSCQLYKYISTHQVSPRCYLLSEGIFDFFPLVPAPYPRKPHIFHLLHCFNCAWHKLSMSDNHVVIGLLCVCLRSCLWAL